MDNVLKEFGVNGLTDDKCADSGLQTIVGNLEIQN